MDAVENVRLVVNTPINNRNDCIDFGERYVLHSRCNILLTHPDSEILYTFFAWKERWKLEVYRSFFTNIFTPRRLFNDWFGKQPIKNGGIHLWSDINKLSYGMPHILYNNKGIKARSPITIKSQPWGCAMGMEWFLQSDGYGNPRTFRTYRDLPLYASLMLHFTPNRETNASIDGGRNESGPRRFPYRILYTLLLITFGSVALYYLFCITNRDIPTYILLPALTLCFVTSMSGVHVLLRILGAMS